MRSYMDDIIEKAASGELKDTGEGGPFVYGWSMRVGPDGVPHVQTFGNVRPQAMRGARELGAGNEREAGSGQRTGTGERAAYSGQRAGGEEGTGEACPPGA